MGCGFGEHQITVPIRVTKWEKDIHHFSVESPFCTFKVVYNFHFINFEYEGLEDKLAECFCNYPKNYLMTFIPHYSSEGYVDNISKIISIKEMES